VPEENPLKKTIVLLGALYVLSGCVSESTMESRPVDQPGTTDSSQKARIHTERAGEYYRMGRLSVSMDAIQQAIAAQPSYVPAHNMLGLIYMELREDAKAQAAFERALNLAPNDSEVLNNYGWFVCQRQNPAKAMPYFQQALRNPLYATPERAYYNAGVCSKKAGDMSGAEVQFRAALQRQPSFAPSMYELAELEFAKGRVKEAESYLASHNRIVSTPNIEALVLGVQIARAQQDKSSESSYIQQLRRRFPEAPQTRMLIDQR
jgi:type IV pilus assembly protein PilF